MAVSARRLPRLEPSRDVNDGPGRPLKELLERSRARRFVVQLSTSDTPSRASVRAPDVLQAVISFVESFAADIDGREIRVTVTDCESGEQHCFALSI